MRQIPSVKIDFAININLDSIEAALQFGTLFDHVTRLDGRSTT
jgi:hypothetical protein